MISTIWASKKLNKMNFMPLIYFLNHLKRGKSKQSKIKGTIFTFISAAAALGCILYLGLFYLNSTKQVSSDLELAAVKSSSPVMLVYPLKICHLQTKVGISVMLGKYDIRFISV